MAVFTNYIRIAVILSVVCFVSGFAHGMGIGGQSGSWGGLKWAMAMPNVPEPSVIALVALGVLGWPLRKRMK